MFLPLCMLQRNFHKSIKDASESSTHQTENQSTEVLMGVDFYLKIIDMLFLLASCL